MRRAKHYVIVGGTRGTGRVIAEYLAAAGNRVSVIGRNGKMRGRNILNFNYDITQAHDIPGLIEKIVRNNGKISHIIFCQRYRGDGDNWPGEWATSLTATRNIIEESVDKFSRSHDKSIIIIGSIVSHFVAPDQPLSYHVAKAALNELVRYYAVNLGPSGIRVNAVLPAAVLKREASGYYRKRNKLTGALNSIIPLRRMGKSEDTLGAVLFLTDARSGYITGQEIVVDGGLSLLAHEGMIRKLSE